MATFVVHPVFGAGAAYLVARDRADAPKFMALSTLCQWLPDIDTLRNAQSSFSPPWWHGRVFV
jgi:hypothetical protein